MGCGSSAAKAASASGHLAAESSLEGRPSSAPVSGIQAVKRTITSALSRPMSSKKPSSADSRFRLFNKQQSLDHSNLQGNPELRGNSASSERSVDSGIGGDATLKSSLDTTLPLATALATKSSNLVNDTRPEIRTDEKSILESLRSEGLLGPQTNTTKGGFTFEVPLGELKVPSKRPPPRLQKLDRNVQMNLSRDQIKEKLARAEKIRKKREQEKLQKNRDKEAKNLEVKLALLKIDQEKNEEDSLKPAKPSSAKNLKLSNAVRSSIDETVKTETNV